MIHSQRSGQERSNPGEQHPCWQLAKDFGAGLELGHRSSCSEPIEVSGGQLTGSSGLGLGAVAHSVAREASAGRTAHYSGPSPDSGKRLELGLLAPRTGLESEPRSS